MSQIAQQLTELLSNYPQFELGILFGSHAAGTAPADSDIDLTVRAEKPITADLKLELMEQIGTHFGRPADIVDLHAAAEPVLGEVFLVVLDRNLFEVPVTQINEAQVKMTLLGEKVVYERNE